jgi:hypothetical protein
MPASGRFQSRLLSYLSRQRLRVRDRTSRWLRHAQNAIALGAQVVLYPVYVAFQSMRLVGRQMGPTAQRMGLFLENVRRNVQGKPALPASPPPADAPIHKTLKAIRSAGLTAKRVAAPESPESRAIALRSPADLIPFVPTEDDRASLTCREASALAASEAAQLRSPSEQALAGNLPTEIGGIASRLDSRLLVLVATKNALIDLSLQQQRWLQQQIIWELADYGRTRRRWLKRSRLSRLGGHAAGALGSSATDEAALGELAPQSPNPLSLSPAGRLARMLPVSMPRETAALPVKAFYQLMAWVQTGPVAIAANLFQEAVLAVYFPPANPDTPPAAPLASPAAWPPSAPALSGAAPATPPNLHPRSPGEVLLHLLAEPEVDLPPAPVPAERIAPVAAIAPLAPPLPQDPMPDPHSLILTISRHAPNPPTPQPLNSPTPPLSPSPSLSPSPNSPYIDTPATLVRYEKHPLEALLDWLDRGMVWLETRLAGLWRWLRGE